MAEKIEWHNEKKKIAELIPAKYNPRQATDKEARDLALSIERFAIVDPIIINFNNTVIGGHFRLRILREKGIEEVDVRVPSRLLTEEEEKELNVRLNKNQGSWDLALLGNFDEAMLLEIGFEPKELKNIVFDSAQLGESFSLPEGEQSGFAQMTFNVTRSQVEEIKAALVLAKEMKPADEANLNSNGSALVYICQEFIKLCQLQKA